MITCIWAQSKNGVIGTDNKLPWNIKKEMEHFRNYTRGKTVLMGRKTWESLPLKPLPNRNNIVITSKNLDFDHDDVCFVRDLNKIVKEYEILDKELVVIGGKQIYDSLLPFTDKLVVSIIKEDYVGDTYAPIVDYNLFNEINIEEHEEFVIKTYERKKENG